MHQYSCLVFLQDESKYHPSSMPASWVSLVCMGKLLYTETHACGMYGRDIYFQALTHSNLVAELVSRTSLRISLFRVADYRECPCKLQSRVYASL